MILKNRLSSRLLALLILGWVFAGCSPEVQADDQAAVPKSAIRFQKIPLVDENGVESGCVFGFENKCYSSLDDLEVGALRQTGNL